MKNTVHLMVDACLLKDQYAKRGTGRYGREMLAGLIKLEELGGYPLRITLIGFDDLASNLAILGVSEEDMRQMHAKIGFYSLGTTKLSNPFNNLSLYYQKIRPAVKALKPNLYWNMHFERGIPSDLVTTVVTVHDAIPLATGQFSQQGKVINSLKGAFYKFMWRKLHKAALIITDTQTGKQDLIENGKLDATKIVAIPLGISEIFAHPKIELNPNEQTYLADLAAAKVKSYLFYDAGLEGNKNATTLVETFAKLVKIYPELHLMLTGGDFTSSTELGGPRNERAAELSNLVHRLGIQSQLVTTGRISDELLATLLQRATAYINFSSYEGFGFGPLQAMAAGVPAIVSNNPCFVEVSGSASLVVDPGNPAEAVTKIAELLGDNGEQAKLTKLGREHAKQFTWKHTLDKTFSSIAKLLA